MLGLIRNRRNSDLAKNGLPQPHADPPPSLQPLQMGYTCVLNSLEGHERRGQARWGGKAPTNFEKIGGYVKEFSFSQLGQIAQWVKAHPPPTLKRVCLRLERRFESCV